jgi:deuterolysin
MVWDSSSSVLLHLLQTTEPAMAFKSLLVLALAAVSLAAPSPSSLKVSVTPVATTAKSKDISLSATVTNPTSEDIKFVRFGSVLDTLPTRSFKVTKDGKEVTFAGMRVCVSIFFRLFGQVEHVLMGVV